MDVGICTAQRDGDPKNSFHNRWRFSQTWNKLQITERTLLMWDLNPYKTHSMQQHDTLRSLLNITEFFFHQVIKDTWVRDTLLATDCPRQPRHNKAKATAQVATANTLFKATTSWSWTQLAPGLWGRCWFKLRFCDEAKMPATHTRPKWWKVTLKRTNWPFPAAHLKGAFASGRRPGIRPSFVFLLVRFGNIAQDESCACQKQQIKQLQVSLLRLCWHLPNIAPKMPRPATKQTSFHSKHPHWLKGANYEFCKRWYSHSLVLSSVTHPSRT